MRSSRPNIAIKCKCSRFLGEFKVQKPIIFVFIGGYLPGKKYGGPVSSIKNFVDHFHDSYEIRIICSNHDFKDENIYPNIVDGWNQVDGAWVYYLNETEYKIHVFKKIVEPYSKRICSFYLSGIYYFKMNFAAIRLAKELQIPVVLAPRGDLMHNTVTMKSMTKMLKKRTFLKLLQVVNFYKDTFFQSTSDEETEGLKHYLGIDESKIFQIENLPSVARPKTRIEKKQGKLRVLYISRLMVKKNPLFAIDVVGKIAKHQAVDFDIYGPIEDKDYWNRCQSRIEEINNSREDVHISYRGALSPDEASKIYGQYDCMIFPTLSENYGHVIVEAMLSDCPVILSKGTTPWDDYDRNGGYVCSLNQVESFVDRVDQMAEMNSDEYAKIVQMNREYVTKRLNIDNLLTQYKNMFLSLT